ncbi:MAG: FtsX-like permease family protein [Actinomycetaceae bacterium]|nr:FtsX-like permease family protein [Actinomycetaceae bacterium]
MWRVTLRGIWANMGRYLLSTLAIVLGVAFLSGTLALRESVDSAMRSLMTSTITGDVYVSGPPATAQAPPEPSSTSAPSTDETEEVASNTKDVPAFLNLSNDLLSPLLQPQNKPLSLDLLPIIKEVPGVSYVNPVIYGSGILLDAKGVPQTHGLASTRVVALYSNPPGPILKSGRIPKGEDEIALESGALKRAGYAIGDKAKMLLGDKLGMYTITGEVTYGSPLPVVTMIYMDPAVLKPIFAPDSKVPFFALSTGSANPVVIADEVSQALGPEAIVTTGDQTRAEREDDASRILGFINALMLLFVALALGVSVFIIANTFSITVQQHAREYALLRALGASRASVFFVVVVQALILGLVGSVLGIALSAGLLRLLGTLLRNPTFGLEVNLDVSWSLSPQVILISLGIGSLVTVISALIPARRAAASAPVDALRLAQNPREKTLLWRTLFGAALLGAGALGLYLGGSRLADPHSEVALGLGAAALLLGILIVAPALVKAFFAVFAWPLAKATPVVGKLARGNVMRSPRRTALTASALFVGLSLITAGAAVASSAAASTAALTKTAIKADLLLVSQSSRYQPAALTERLLKIEDIEQVITSVSTGSAQVILPKGSGAQVQVSTVTIPSATHVFPFTMAEGTLSCLEDGQIIVTPDEAARHQWKLGDSITLAGVEGTYTSRLCAIGHTDALAGTSFFTTPLVAKQIGLTGRNTQVYPLLLRGGVISSTMPTDTLPEGVSMEPSTTSAPKPQLTWKDTKAWAGHLAEVQEKAQESVADLYAYRVMTPKELENSSAHTARQVLLALYALLGLSVIIAILGIVNTLTLAILERGREISLLRSIGLSRGATRWVIVVESVLTSLFASSLGLATGLVLAYSFQAFASDLGLTVFAVPWVSLIIIVLVACVAGWLAALIPAAQAARRPILDSVLRA